MTKLTHILPSLPLASFIYNHIITYPTATNLSYFWGFGSLSGLTLVIQIVTGVCLARHYTPEVSLAFSSVEHIIRDVYIGSTLRYRHANGASMFLLVVYIHIFRGLYYGSYVQPRSNLWYSGVLIFFLIRATAFIGYVLPWGQMSFWGATVITNLFSAIPEVGIYIVQLLWGGFSVDNPTLNRFFSLHFFIPFIIAGAAGLHLTLLHQNGSNNPLGFSSLIDRINFYPYLYVKDLFAFFRFITFFSFIVVYIPNLLGHPDNYIEANSLVTPAHIVPEWYFLPFYAVLRAIPDKLGGVALIGIAIAILLFLPNLDTSNQRSGFWKPVYLKLFWMFFFTSLCLGWIGQEIVESPFIEVANYVTFIYFAFFILCLPLNGYLFNPSNTKFFG
jgi:ubiquinol-cytochrome c reductase cytochrome b subunit